MPKIHIPEDFLCPITQELMHDPVATADGQIYERKAIEAWLVDHDTSPLTNEKLPTKTLTVIPFVKKQIQGFLETNKPCTVEQFIATAKQGDIKTMESLNYFEQDIDGIDANGKTALHWAVENGHVDMANFLLDLKANPHSKDSGGYTILQRAIKNNLSVIIKRILSDNTKFKLYIELIYHWYKDDKVKKEECSGTLLHWAVMNNDLMLMKQLIQAPIDLNVKNNEGHTALYLALEQDRVEIAKVLLTAKVDLNAHEKYLWIDKEDKNKRVGTLLHWAINNNDLVTLTLLTQFKVNPDTKDDRNNTPLYYAIQKNWAPVVQLLLTAKADVKAHTTYKWYREKYGRKEEYSGTVLHWAIDNNHEEIFKILLDANSDLNAKDTKGYTALHLAIEKKNIVFTRLLLKAKANPNININNTGHTPLALAFHADPYGGSGLEYMKLLLQAGAAPNTVSNCYWIITVRSHYTTNDQKRSGTLLQWAVEKNYLDLVVLLLQAKASLYGPVYWDRTSNGQNSYGQPCQYHLTQSGPLLQWAIEKKHNPILKLLLEDNAKYSSQFDYLSKFTWFLPNKSYPYSDITASDTLLHWAHKNNDAEIMAVILKNKIIVANLNQEDSKTLLTWSVENSYIEIVKLLLEILAKGNSSIQMDKNVLRLAIDKKNETIVELLLSVLQLTATDSDLLQVAVEKGNKGIVNLLLAVKLNPNTQDASGNNALHRAVSQNDKELVKTLLNADANPNVKNKMGITPLILAIYGCFQEVFQLLLASGADPCFQNPLKYAVAWGNVHAVNSLLEVKVDPHTDKSLLPYAVFGGHTQVVEQLLKARVNPNSIKTYTWPQKLLPTGALSENTHTKNVSKPVTPSQPSTIIYEADDILDNHELSLAPINHDLSLLFIDNETHLIKSDKMTASGTLLHWAAENNHISLVTLLLTAQTDINAQDKKGKTSLHLAVEKNHALIVEMLLMAKAHLNSQDYENKTPLYYALLNNYDAIVRLLLGTNKLDTVENELKQQKELILAIQQTKAESNPYKNSLELNATIAQQDLKISEQQKEIRALQEAFDKCFRLIERQAEEIKDLKERQIKAEKPCDVPALSFHQPQINNQLPLNLSTQQIKERAKAANRIQAIFRGYRLRKQAPLSQLQLQRKLEVEEQAPSAIHLLKKEGQLALAQQLEQMLITKNYYEAILIIRDVLGYNSLVPHNSQEENTKILGSFPFAVVFDKF